MNSNLNVRQAVVADVASLVRLNDFVQMKHADWYPEIFHGNASGNELHKFFTKILDTENSFVFVVEVGEVISGMLWCERVPEHNGLFAHRKPSLHIHHIVVDPEKERTGMGSCLLECANNLAKDKGCVFIRLDTWANNTEAHRFFEASGFEIQRLTYTRPV